jgi:SAM-dependent methyltransferase
MACYLCNESNSILRRGEVRDSSTLEIRECQGCGLVYLSSAEHLKSGHYESSGMHGSTPPSMEAWLRETSEDDARRFKMLQRSLVNKSLLDFGCGCGGFLELASSVATRADGVELEQRVPEYWAERIKIHSDLDSIHEQFDIVTAFHVIEHLEDPREYLRKLAARLLPGGRLVIEVPSSEDALLTFYECDAFQRYTYWSQHLYLFNTQTLKQLVAQAGLRIVAVEQYQRYPLSNHLYWLNRGVPGGHKKWGFLDTQELHSAYSAALSAMGRCDTLIAYIECDNSI